MKKEYGRLTSIGTRTYVNLNEVVSVYSTCWNTGQGIDMKTCYGFSLILKGGGKASLEFSSIKDRDATMESVLNQIEDVQ